MEHVVQERLSVCPICGAADLLPDGKVRDYHLSKEVFELVRCLGCGFVFTNPRPTQEHIGLYYASENYISHSDMGASISDRLYRIARNRALRRKHRLVANYAATGRLLDVGCGTGSFLHFMIGRGYDMVGVEPSERARAVANQSHPGAAVATLSELERSATFDVITLWHVLEHLPELSTAFREFGALLRPTGHLFIAVPDRTSWDRKHYGEQWAAWDVPRHLSHFRPKDIANLLEQHGFKLVSTRRMWFDAPYICMLSERYRGRGPLVALALGIVKGSWSNLVALVMGGSTSSSLYIARRR
ncbi:MAG: class I SAM-dependent methyltransferase [Flavobacteriales bacterium]